MKLKDTQETHTYTSKGGYYVITQPYSDEGMGVILSPEQMRLLIVDMEAKLLSADEWWSVQDKEGEE